MKKLYKDLTFAEKKACISLFPEEAKSDKNWLIRLKAFRTLGFPEEAKLDEDWLIRLEAFKILGFTEEAKLDKAWKIRLAAFRNLGFTEKAKKDEAWEIREEATLFFNILNQCQKTLNKKTELE